MFLEKLSSQYCTSFASLHGVRNDGSSEAKADAEQLCPQHHQTQPPPPCKYSHTYNWDHQFPAVCIRDVSWHHRFRSATMRMGAKLSGEKFLERREDQLKFTPRFKLDRGIERCCSGSIAC